MKRGQGILVVAALVALGGGGYTAWAALKAGRERGAVVVSHSGRDQALVRLIQGARRSISVRTECLTLTPVGNELAQAFQRGVSVRVELPLQVGTSAAESRLPRILMELGAPVSFRSDPAGNYRGAYLEVDGRTFFYSAAPLAPNGQGALVSYVAGPLGWRG
jgi:phosphatidylserine/phosphatidylglycerophosphate/cardiolipin synthase-like enzyme